MTSEEKIKFVKDMILEKEKISPPGICRIDLYDILDSKVIEANNGIPDEAPTVLSRADQRLILKKLEIEGYLKELWSIDEDSYWVETSGIRGENSSENELIQIHLGKQVLKLNKVTGFVKLNNVESKLNPSGEEFKFLIKLMTSKLYSATYKDLLIAETTKAKKRNLSFVVRNLKGILGILPKNKAKNIDIIKNTKNYGYYLDRK